MSILYSCNFANNNDSLSMPTAFDVMFNASISRSENYSSDSLTKLPTICLYGLGFFANIVLLYFLLKSFNLLNINNMHNFLYINLFINLIPPTDF